MLKKTRGICLHTLKYNDSSIIVHIYTEVFGRQSYIIKGVYGKKATIKSNIFYPLNLLELEVQQRGGTELQNIKDVRNFPVYSNIPFNASKNAIVIFISEILYRSLREEMPNPPLFEFISNALMLLDLETDIADFHLVFLIQLTKYTGFYPLNNHSIINCYFDLLNGQFVSLIPEHSHYMGKSESKKMAEIMNKNFTELVNIEFSRSTRYCMLEKIIDYYRLHIDGIGKINSLEILKEIFD
jgi:DNA repair protein RecO (recombination protein O)